MPKDTRPDCDNIVKLLQDVLTDLEFWNDDGQIAMLQVCKFYAEKPSVIIDVEPYIALRRDEP
jgi:Holliday junction resolvase RusA-like endonuclease